MSAAEFAHTSPIKAFEHDETQEDTPLEFLALSLRFDPYSPNAAEEYELLRSEIEKYDIIGLLRTEIAKSRVDPSTTRHIVKSLKFIAHSVRDQAALTLFDGIENLYPIFPTVMIVAKQLWPDLSPGVQGHIGRQIRSLFFSRSRLVKTEVNQAYAVRLLSCEKGPENIELFTSVFEKARSSTVRRDVVLAMFNWRNWPWISDLRSQFQSFSPPLRRAFIVASYSLGDEGKHWRKHNKDSFSSLERVLQEWVSLRVNRDSSCGWQVPL